MEEEDIRMHQYPDPDYAAYITKYPWVRDDQGHNPVELQSSLGAYTDDNRSIAEGALCTGPELEADIDGLQHSKDQYNQTGIDPDYQASENEISDDGDASEEASEEASDSSSPYAPESIRSTAKRYGRPYPQSIAQSGDAAARGFGGIGRRGRRGGPGRGGRGVKRGLRKPVEPTLEFKALHSEATMAFIDRRYEEAEHLTLQALQLNPEMYPAHTLLSEIHAARGDKNKALSAAWNGAHTRPRDTQMWSKIARLILERDGDDRVSILRDAVYCYNRIISVDKQNVDARYQRAALNHELGHKRKVASEYEQLIKQLPNDTTVLRHLAEIYIELNEPHKALCQYEASIAHFQTHEPHNVTSFTWSDINIVSELYGFQKRYQEGISRLKYLSRWLLGRRADHCWEDFHQDDREWDLDDRPRRIEVPTFVPGKYRVESYGDSLPLELRIKLGIFRLNSNDSDSEEAIRHFKWLDPDDHQIGAKLFDYPDLFREAANSLRSNHYFREALQYYEPLLQVTDYADTSHYLEMASCYRAIGLGVEAEECYKAILENDENNAEARSLVTDMRRRPGFPQEDLRSVENIISADKNDSRRHTGARGAIETNRATATECSATSMLAPRPMPQSAKRVALDKWPTQQEDIHQMFLQRQKLAKHDKQGEESSRAQRTMITKSLMQIFRDNKIFYPFDKHHKFFGYSREARLLASRPKYELDTLTARSKSVLEKENGEQVIIPEEYCGILFEDWLDVFLEHSLSLAQDGDIKSAYETIAAAFHANVFYHSPEALFSIHVCWFTCALLGNDDETLCNVARWFMKEYQFVTDGYRLFAALNRLCESDNSWYNCGPSQKYILRQLKAVDFSFVGDARRKSLFQERASYTTKDSNGSPIHAEEMDVALLMLYGHILYAGKSYAYAVNYFLRALSLDSENPLIKLSLALGYIHYALKRQADNRHHILMQGFAFLMEYYDLRQESGGCLEKQEAEYNVGRTYHLLGLTHLAIPYYQRCLDLSEIVQEDHRCSGAEDFAQEAAFAMQGLWAASGNLEKAQQVTEIWLSI